MAYGNQGRGQQGGGQQQGGGGGGGRSPTHRIIAKPDDRGRRGQRTRYEQIGVAWESERGGISLRFNAFCDLRAIIDQDAHVMVVPNDSEEGRGDFGGDDSPPPGDNDRF